MIKDKLSNSYLTILESIGEDPTREGLLKTPERAARALKFLTQGYHQNLNDIVNEALFKSEIDELIIVKDIDLYSLCEHHLLPFFGKCHIGYFPKGKVLGLSKIARIVDYYARRLQIQEKLTKQIGETLMDITGAAGVGVIIEAKHLCMIMRGIEKQNSYMCTSVLLGTLREGIKRAEFLSLVKDT